MGVLEEVTLHQLHQLRSFQAHRVAVPDPKPASEKMKSAVQAALGVDESVPISAGRIVVAHNRSVVSGDVVVMQATRPFNLKPSVLIQNCIPHVIPYVFLKDFC